MVEYTSFPFVKIKTSKKVEQIEKDITVKKALEKLLTSSYVQKAFPSHNFGHAYTTALTATQKAVEEGIKDKKVLRNIFLAGIYHDSYRIMSQPSGLSSVKKAARFTIKELRGIIQKEDLKAKYLNYADALEYAPIRAIYMGRIELTKYNPALKNAPSEAGLAIYNQIYEQKMAQLPEKMRQEIKNEAKR